ncbi:SurA N-terminal domain-containing protein [Arthrobacter sp. Br18]|uniref:SurA N-terminal domain-containing protein n=1 Tax=Arthrobacter sp. Br18 TaxID=1312954 RepID=UPI00047B50CC|nr:SurA N-terminal domain-containing protein [Arthrobacter sp. Br18]
MLKKQWLMGLVLAGSVSVAGCSAASENPSEGSDTQQEAPAEGSGEAAEGGEAAAQEALPEPDLEGIPDVVAEVNGEKILKDQFTKSYEGQFQQVATQSQMSGEEVDQEQLKTQTADTLIGSELLVQEVEKRGITASTEEIDASWAKLIESSQLGSKEEVIAAIAEQGIDEAEVTSQVEAQVGVDKLIAEEAGETTATEEELSELYEQVKAQQGAAGGPEGQESEFPSFDEARPALEEQVRGQKEGAAAEALVASLREGADVVVHL